MPIQTWVARTLPFDRLSPDDFERLCLWLVRREGFERPESPGGSGDEGLDVVAWKDGQGDLRTYQRIIERVGDRLHWIGGVGDDMVPGYYSIGIRTFTSAIAGIAPRLSLQLHERASLLDAASLSRLMSNYVLPLYALRVRRKGYEVSVIKAAMEILGKPAGPVRPPLVNVRPEERTEIEALMERYKPVL